MDAALRLCIAQAICTIHLDPKLRFNVVQVTQRLLNELFQTVKTDSRGSGTTLPGRFLQPTTMALSNASIIAFKDNDKAMKKAAFADWYRMEFPDSTATDAELGRMYDKSVSIFQSKAGTLFEGLVKAGIEFGGIPVYAQVHVNPHTGRVIPKKGKTETSNRKILDFVIGGPPIVIGDTIGGRVIASAKLSTRDRLDEDLWIQHLPNHPKLFLYLNADDDYPDSEKFKEGPTRKLICAKPRDPDNRQFKLGFEHLVAEVQAALA
jgi:hypothetical protein